MTFILSIGLSILLLLAYFRLAERFRIVDKPSERGSHSHTVIRGGGLIFPLILIIYQGLAWSAIIDAQPYPYVIAAVLLSALIAFWDDVRPLPYWLRLSVYTLSAFVILWYSGGINDTWWLLVIALLLYTAFINAVNFMDGINGITGTYALVFFATCFLVQSFTSASISPNLYWMIIGALLAFLSFNFRKKAQCFAGDVGAISLGLLMGFFWFHFMDESPSWLWLLLPALYGVDTAMTIAFRLWRGEPIFKPHRHHAYQHLANEWEWGHLPVAILYSVLQFCINAIAILTFLYWPNGELFITLLVYFLLVVMYVYLKRITLRRFDLPFYG